MADEGKTAEKRVLRRDFLKMVGAVVGAAVLPGCAPPEKPTLVAGAGSEPPAVQLPESGNQLLSENRPFDGGYVTFENGIPIRVVFDNGTTDEIPEKDVINAQEVLKSNPKPPIVFYHSPAVIKEVPFLGSQSEPGESRPEIYDLPPDFIQSPEKLYPFGVEVINSPRVSLAINKKAFTAEGPLAFLAEKEIGLTIALVDNRWLSARSIADSRYDGVRELYLSRAEDQDPKILRNRIFSETSDVYQEYYNLINQAIAAGDEETVKTYKNKFLTLYGQLQIYSTLSDNNLVNIAVLADGRMIKPGAEGGKPDRAFIFLAVGKQEKLVSASTLLVYLDKEGFGIFPVEICNFCKNPEILDSEPQRKFSFPRPGDLAPVNNITQDPTIYLYSYLPASLVLIHEIEHFKQWARGKEYSEYEADAAVRDYVQEAYKRYLSTGDPSSFYLAFTIPPEKGGGWMISRKGEATSKPPTA